MAFIEQHRTSIIAEILALLRAPVKPLDFYTRWADWEANVLCRLENADLCQDKITARQQDLDAEQDEANLILEHFERQLVKNAQRT